MDWFDESHFPQPDEFESSFEYGEGVYNAILNRFNRKHGGTLREELDKTAHAYAHLYAFTKWNSEFVVEPEDIEWMVEVPFDDPSIQVIKAHTSKITTILNQHGWVKVDTDYCFSDSKWSDRKFIHVYQRDQTDSNQPMVPGLSTILDEIGTDCILSATALRGYMEQRLNETKRDVSCDKETIDAYVAAIETRIEERGWLDIEAHDAPDRLWFEPDALFDHLIERLGENQTISDADFKQEISQFIEANVPKVESDTTFNLQDFFDPFYQKIRVRDWFEVEFEDEVTWYRSKEDQRKALSEYIHQNGYGEVLESPSRFDYETYDLRQSAYRFFRENKWAVSEHDFYEMSVIERQLRYLEYYADVDERFEELEGSKVADGTWDIVPNAEDDDTEPSDGKGDDSDES